VLTLCGNHDIARVAPFGANSAAFKLASLMTPIQDSRVTVVDGVPTFQLPASVELRHSERDDFLCLMRPSGTAPVAPTGSLVLQFQQCNLVALSRDDCIKALLIDHDARCSDVRDEECRSWA